MKYDRGRHQTLAKELKREVDWLESQSEVQRVIIGIAAPCRHKYAPGTLRFRRSEGKKIFLNGYMGTGVRQIVTIATSEKAVQKIEQAISGRYHGGLDTLAGPKIDRSTERKSNPLEQ